MRETPTAIVISEHRPASYPDGARGIARGGLFVAPVTVLVGFAILLLAPLLASAQTFLRVTPPGNDQPSAEATAAIPPATGNQSSAEDTGRPVISATPDLPTNGGEPPAMLDVNGKPVSNSIFEWKNWRPTFYGNVRFTYDDNIFIQRNKTGDFVTTLEPGIVLGWGDYRAALPRLGSFEHEFEIPGGEAEERFLYLDYHPSIDIFAENSKENAVDEYLLVAGSYRIARLTLSGQLSYQSLSGANIDVGNRVNRDLYSAQVTAAYDYNLKTSIDSTLGSFAQEYQGNHQSSVDTADRTFLGFQVAPKTNVAGGLGLGYLIPSRTSNQLYQQLLGRVRWAASDQLYVEGTAGVEFRQTGGGGVSQINGIFDFTANWAPFDGTRINLLASRQNQAAEAQIGQDLLTTNVQVGIQQRFLGRVYVTGSVRYTNVDYQHESAGSQLNRVDNYVAVGVSAGMDLTKYAGIQIAFRLLENDSNQAARTFDEHLVRLQFNLIY